MGKLSTLSKEQISAIRSKWGGTPDLQNFDIEDPKNVIAALLASYDAEKKKADELEDDVAMSRLREVSRLGFAHRK